MPELPEIEHLRRTLTPAIVGSAVRRVRVRRADVVRTPTGRRPTAASLLGGGVVRRLLRHGKQLAIVADDGRCICIHLGMSGQLLFVPGGATLAQTDHVHCRWLLERDGRRGTLVFRDPRRFGGVWTYPTIDAMDATRWERLGPDALSVSTRDLRRRLQRRERAVKSALLDQAILAGVGNIYADESLFRARIHPARRCSTLTAVETRHLACAIRTVLRSAVRSGGTTLRDYVDANGRRGGYVTRHMVYGRTDQPCRQCSTPLLSTSLAQRTTSYCPHCQHEPVL